MTMNEGLNTYSRWIMLGDGLQMRKLSLAVMALFVVSLSFSMPVFSQNQTAYEGPGFETSYPEENMLFLKGVEGSPYLDRNWTTVTGLPSGSTSFSKTSSFTLPTIVDAQTPPVIEPFRFEGNITVRLYASLETTSNACSATNIPLGGPLGSETQFSVTLSMGGFEALSSVTTDSIVMSKDRTDPHIFEATAYDLNVSMNSGDEIRLSIQVSHECAVSGTLWWGSYDSRTGVILDGQIIETELNVVIDHNRMARIEFTPISPWGGSDFSAQSIELVGPMEWREMWHGSIDPKKWLDHFESPDGLSKGESNRTVRTWSTEEPLTPGNYMLDACFTLSDQDPGETCHSWAMLRFHVPEDDPPLLGSFFAAIIVCVGLIAWFGASLRGANLPLPAYAAIILLAIASSFTAIHLPEIDSNSYREGGAAPPFFLLSHDSELGAVSLSELMEDSDVVVIGMFTSGSPNAKRQMNDFQIAENILSQDGVRASFVQIATGEGLQAFNIDDYANELNGTWPLLLDDSTVGASLPSGATDAVIVIDSAGFIAEWSPGSMPSSQIKEASEKASSGSGNSPIKLVSMLLGTSLLPLFVLGMPSDRKFNPPEQPLIPAAGAFLTIFASSIGFLIWAIPVSLFSSLGMGAQWVFVEILISLTLVYHGFSMLLRGNIFEIERISDKFHSLLGVNYREWRGVKTFSEDVYLGLWLAWLTWLLEPSLIAQGVGAVARSSITGAIFSPFLLFGFSICAGLSVLIVRSFVILFGRIPRLLGMLSVGVRPRAWGVVVGLLGVWTLVSIIIGPLYSAI